MTVMPCPQCGEYIEDNLFGTQCKKCGYKVGQAISVLGYQTRVMCDCSAELTALRAQVSALQTEVKHWRDQHANEVRRARILKDTTDLPLERVRGYELMGELQGQVKKLKAMIARKEDLRRLSSEAQYVAERECDQLRAEVERLKSQTNGCPEYDACKDKECHDCGT